MSEDLVEMLKMPYALIFIQMIFFSPHIVTRKAVPDICT